MQKIPPFRANLADNKHCLQASVAMAVEAINGQHMSFEKLNDLSGKGPEPYTWPLRLIINLLKMGFDVKYIDAFNLRDFIIDAHTALHNFYSPEIALDQIKKTDIPKVQNDAKELLEASPESLEFRTPDLPDIGNLLDQGYLLVCNVNAKALKGVEGYSGHFVLVYKHNKGNLTITLHNPGLPAAPSLECHQDTFRRAWSAGGDNYRSILAIRQL